ncbi:MAG: hypothetical protein RI977_706 [Bacteroidota bacterium]
MSKVKITQIKSGIGESHVESPRLKQDACYPRSGIEFCH